MPPPNPHRFCTHRELSGHGGKTTHAQHCSAHRKRVFCSCMDRWLPRYRCGDMVSVDTTSAREPGRDPSKCLARSIEIKPAEQPMPDKLYDRMFDRMPNLQRTRDKRSTTVTACTHGSAQRRSGASSPTTLSLLVDDHSAEGGSRCVQRAVHAARGTGTGGGWGRASVKQAPDNVTRNHGCVH